MSRTTVAFAIGVPASSTTNPSIVLLRSVSDANALARLPVVSIARASSVTGPSGMCAFSESHESW